MYRLETKIYLIFQAKLSSSKHRLPFQFCVNGLPGGKPTDKQSDKKDFEGHKHTKVSSIPYRCVIFRNYRLFKFGDPQK